MRIKPFASGIWVAWKLLAYKCLCRFGNLVWKSQSIFYILHGLWSLFYGRYSPLLMKSQSLQTIGWWGKRFQLYHQNSEPEGNTFQILLWDFTLSSLLFFFSFLLFSSDFCAFPKKWVHKTQQKKTWSPLWFLKRNIRDE